MWVVIADTPAMRAQAATDVPAPFGVIAADPEADQLRVIRPADKRRGQQRAQALTTALLRSI